MCHHIQHTFCHVPHVVVVCDLALPQEFLHLRMPVSYYAVQLHTTSVQEIQASGQSLLFHMITASNLIALNRNTLQISAIPHQKSYDYCKGVTR